MSTPLQPGVPLHPVGADEAAAQMERILHSETLRSSETLRKLLEYLASRVPDSTPHSVKAREIAAAVFGRNGDFDAQNDSIVRVQAGRLRTKLVEYAAGEGADDELVVSLPKGSYELSVCPRECAVGAVAAEPEAVEPAVVVAGVEPLPRERSPLSRRWLYAGGLLGVAVLTWLVAAITYSGAFAPRTTPALATFWHGFLSHDDAALMVYSNIRVRSLESDKIYLFPSNGDLLAIYNLTRFFTAARKPVRPKHGNLLAWDEAKDVDLVFVGGPLAETPLRVLPNFHEFAFKYVEQPPEASERIGGIANLHPKPGEPEVWTDTSSPRRFDYAVVAVTAAFSPRHQAVTVAGISGYGTQGAAEFVTREERVQELLARLGVRPGAVLPPFEAVLRFTVQGGVALRPEIVAVRVLN